MSVRRLVVIGGGISGLAAAWAARRAVAGDPDALDVLVLEREADVGGKARTIVRDGWLVEGGPGGFLGGRPEMDRLIAAGGLEGERVAASRAAAHRFLFTAGVMREVPTNPVAFARSGILSARGLLRVVGEPFVPRRTDDADESVWSFAARRFGAQVADRLISPMTLGIYAGDARQLSVRAAFPRMTALEREHGSLIRGLLARRGKASSGALTSFRAGMQSLPRALAARGGFRVRCRADVHALTRTGSGWQLRVAGDTDPIAADAVVLAGEPWAAAALLRAHDERVAADLDGIHCPPVAVVALGYAPRDAARVPNGFGVLIARGQGLRALGNLWESRIYPARSPDGHVLIRAMFGGQVDPKGGVLPPGVLIELARAEIATVYGITAEPVMREVVRWERAIPQYAMGHLARVARIEGGVGAMPGLFITGYGLGGIAFADAAANGVRCGEVAGEYCKRLGTRERVET